MTLSRDERTHWRDEAISLRHREWGFHCPATDIDFLLNEYDGGKTKALIEYKHEGSSVNFLNPTSGMHPKSYDALRDLSNRAGIPIFVVRYKEDFSFWQVFSLNDIAKAFLKSEETLMTEKEYVTFLYKLRGMDHVPIEIYSKLRG